MWKFSRRKLLVGTGALLLSRAVPAAPRRLLRKDCFFGLHFDLHPRLDDTELGRDVTDEMVAHLLESARPDFIQYDSKGHPGYLGFASKTGMSSPGIAQTVAEHGMNEIGFGLFDAGNGKALRHRT